jgi:ribonuclease T2
MGDASNANFWSHEYTKHGTCAEQLPQFADELMYFTGALQALATNNVTHALAAAGIVPSASASYALGNISAALVDGVGATGGLACDKSNNLQVIELCLDKSLSVIQCPANVRTSCKAGDVRLPPAH